MASSHFVLPLAFKGNALLIALANPSEKVLVDEIAFGPGAWDNQLPAEVKATMIRNAPTFLDEIRDPTQLTIDEDSLAGLAVPVRLTQGSESPPLFPRVIDRLEPLIPHVVRETIPGVAHVSASMRGWGRVSVSNSW